MTLFKSLRLHFKSREVREDLRLALSGRLCQQILYLSCAVIHFIMIFIFYGYGVDVMMYFNIASTIFYAASFLLVTLIKKKNIALMDIAIAEILVFSVVSCVAVGWECGFALYLICMIPGPFFMPYDKLSTSIFTSVFLSASFIGTRIYVSDTSHITHLVSNETQQMKLYIFNASMGIIMITFMAFMFIVSRHISTEMMNEQNDRLKQLASIDPLTELFNRRAMMEYLDRMHEEAVDTLAPYAIAIGDIDNFKKINDTYGHKTGDEVLKKVSAALTSVIPSEGYICRWGGEEILYALPDCRPERAELIAESVRREVEQVVFSSQGKYFHVSMTFGLVMADLQKSFESSINIADDYMYAGKRNGKNIVVTQKVFDKLEIKE